VALGGREFLPGRAEFTAAGPLLIFTGFRKRKELKFSITLYTLSLSFVNGVVSLIPREFGLSNDIAPCSFLPELLLPVTITSLTRPRDTIQAAVVGWISSGCVRSTAVGEQIQ